MRAFEVRDGFGLDHLHLGERPAREPGPGEVALAMRAVSLNYRDWLTVVGQYNPKQRLPLIPCSDGVGVVTELGPTVTGWQVGDRAVPIFAQRWLAGEPTREKVRSTLGGPLDGTLCERMVVPAASLVAPPAHLTDAEAATLPCAALTAWNALLGQGDLQAGDTVLVQGTGGVALFALQFAQLAGARVIITSGSDEKLARARALGAWEGINYRREPGWGARAKDLTGGRGVDLVVEVGGAGTLAESLRATRFGGTVAMIGVLAGGVRELNVVPIFMQQVRLQGVLVGHRESFEAMNRAISHHQLRPVVDRVSPWTDARAAFEHLAAGRHFGKVCLEIFPGEPLEAP